VGLEFPVGNPLDLWHGEYASIPADGSDVIGKVYFQDPDGDMSYAYFEPLEDDSPFSSFGFYLNELYAEDLEGDEYEGAFLFWISCTTQGQHSFGVSLQDEAGNWSQWGVLIFQCK
jgi:hypothetical protein